MQYTNDYIIWIIIDACKILIEKDSSLLEIDISERALTHRLAIYLEQLIPAESKNWYFVDCEYNRDGFAKKAIILNDKESSIYPDIIVHQRCSIGNLLIIEAKKNSTKWTKEQDRKKLEQYVKEYNYEYAIFIDFKLSSKSFDIYSLNKVTWLLEKQ